MGHWSPSIDCFSGLSRGKFSERSTVIRDVGELINCDLTLTAANGSSVPYKGWVELEFQGGDSGNTTSVPFLVANEKLELPLLGFNVIEHLIKVQKLDCNDISSNFPGTTTFNAPALVEFVNNISHAELCSVKTGRKDVVIPRGQTVKVSCRVNTGPLGKGTPVLFEADEDDQWPSGLEVQDTLVNSKGGKASRIAIEIQNTTRHDISLKSRTVLGRLQLVQSVTPVEVRLKNDHTNIQKPIVSESNDFIVSETHDCTAINLPDHLKDVNLGDLTNEQRTLASRLLIEQADAFSKADDDVGCIPNLQMDIPLNDKTPVQKNYVAVPRPLYPEVKSYVEDLLNRILFVDQLRRTALP